MMKEPERTLETTKRTLKSKQSYVIVRPGVLGAGVWAGYLVRRCGHEATLRDCRRIWYWDGAATLAELAEYGTATPAKCKFPPPVGEIDHLDVQEVLYCSARGRESIQEVPEWRRNA